LLWSLSLSSISFLFICICRQVPVILCFLSFIDHVSIVRIIVGTLLEENSFRSTRLSEIAVAVDYLLEDRTTSIIDIQWMIRALIGYL